MENTTGRGFEWDDEIENDGNDFALLPEGDYDFEVIDFERGRHSGSAKLPPCNKATIYLQVKSPEGTAVIKHQLFLHTITEGMLSSFFRAIGQKKHGERLKMDWNKVKGATGRCKVYINEYTKDNGEPGKSNKVKKFYYPEEQKSTPSFTPGSF